MRADCPRLNHLHRQGFTMVELIMVLLILTLISTLAIQRYNGIVKDARQQAVKNEMMTLTRAIEDYMVDMESVPYYTPVIPDNGYDYFNFRPHCLILRSNHSVSNSTDPPSAIQRYVHASETVFVPEFNKGWNGPYLKGLKTELVALPAGNNPDGTKYEAFILDPWGTPYIIQVPDFTVFASRVSWDDKKRAEKRWEFARLISGGPNGYIDTPDDLCAGRSREDVSLREDDIVYFLNRSDVFELVTDMD